MAAFVAGQLLCPAPNCGNERKALRVKMLSLGRLPNLQICDESQAASLFEADAGGLRRLYMLWPISELIYELRQARLRPKVNSRWDLEQAEPGSPCFARQREKTREYK